MSQYLSPGNSTEAQILAAVTASPEYEMFQDFENHLITVQTYIRSNYEQVTALANTLIQTARYVGNENAPVENNLYRTAMHAYSAAEHLLIGLINQLKAATLAKSAIIEATLLFTPPTNTNTPVEERLTGFPSRTNLTQISGVDIEQALGPSNTIHINNILVKEEYFRITAYSNVQGWMNNDYHLSLAELKNIFDAYFLHKEGQQRRERERKEFAARARGLDGGRHTRRKNSHHTKRK